MSTVIKDLGAVSAYAYAVEKGYTGTEAEFAELMADYAEVGQRAEDAANSALESKTAAQTAATTATNKASEAATSAQTATTKAGEATTAAGTATTAKNDAVAAKTAAETAQGKAEDAQAAAESVAESIPSDYSQLSEDVSDLKEELNTIETSDYTSAYESGSITLNVGVGSTVNPTPNTSGNYKYQIIPCSYDDSFVITGTGGDAPRLWGFTDENYKLLTVAGPNYTETSRTLTASEKGYFISNVNKNSPYALTATIAKSRIDDLDVDVYALQNSVGTLDNTVIDMKKGLVSSAVKYGKTIDVSGASFFKNAKCSGLNSDYSPIIVSDISFLITMPIPSDVGRIWIKKFTQTGQMILLYTVGLKGVNYTKSSNPDTNLIYNGNDYVVLDCAAAITAGYTTMLLSFDSEEDSGIYEYAGIFTVKDNLDYVTPLTGLNMFESVACLGDSYTQGFIVKSDASAQIAKKPYPAVLQDRLGITVDNYGVGGTTAKSYITHTDGLPTVLKASAHDLYMICFGINDSGQSVTIGTVADINDSDYTKNADTFCGNLGKMYQMLIEQFPNARYVFIGNWGVGLWYAAYSPYAKAAKKVAEHFGVPYVNPLDDLFFYNDIFVNNVGGHPTQVAYTGMAYAIERLMSKCIADNYLYYSYAGVEPVEE